MQGMMTAMGLSLIHILNKSGNVSARACRADGAEGFLITPTGMPYESLTPDDLVWIPLVNPPSLRNADGARRPSSEWEMHARVYLRRSDIDAVVHTHSCFATALACQDMPIPPFHYMVAAAGGHSIDVAPYATFGTQMCIRDRCWMRLSVPVSSAAEAAEVRSMPAQSRPVSGRESFMVELLKTCV